MEKKTICKIYFNQGSISPVLFFCEGIWNGNINKTLLQRARTIGMEQAISYNVKNADLEEQSVSVYNSFIIPARNSLCVELKDTEEMVKYFLKKNHSLLKFTNLILIKNYSFN